MFIHSLYILPIHPASILSTVYYILPIHPASILSTTLHPPYPPCLNTFYCLLYPPYPPCLITFYCLLHTAFNLLSACCKYPSLVSSPLFTHLISPYCCHLYLHWGTFHSPSLEEACNGFYTSPRESRLIKEQATT